MNEEIDMAYAAGILDGDGSFSIMKAHGKYYPCIQLSNAFEGMSKWLYEKFGGSLRVKKPQQLHHKVFYVWSVRGMQGCKDLIEKIEFNLALKRKQAKLMWDFISDRLQISFDDVKGERYCLEMRNLNRNILLNKDESLCPQTINTSRNHNFWSYIAGIMDTEGSFSIKKEKPHSGSISIRYNPIIQLTMVPVEVLNYLRKNCSIGAYCIPKAKCTQKGYAYKFSICGKEKTIKFISYLRDYLRFKKKQAELLIKFCENFGNTKYRQGKVSPEFMVFREDCYQQMRQLNK